MHCAVCRMHCAGVRIIGFGSFTLDLLHTSGPSYERHWRTAKFTVPWRVHDEWKSKSHFLYCQKHTPFLRATISTYSRGGSLVRLQTVGTYIGPGYESGNSHNWEEKTGRVYYVILWKTSSWLYEHIRTYCTVQYRYCKLVISPSIIIWPFDSSAH